MRRIISAFPVLLFSTSALAYDTETHAWMMYQGYLKSNLAAAPPLRERQVPLN